MLITRADTFDAMCRAFTWRLPERMNIASLVCDRHAARAPDSIALLHEQADGSAATFSFAAVQRLANRCAHTFERHLRLQRGDRVMIYLGQDPATAVAHVACWKAGMVSVPTSVLFGTDALEYRLRDSGAKALITDAAHYPAVAAVRDRVGELQTVLLTDGAAERTLPFWDTLARASDAYDTLALTPDTPAFINYTSGTTGPPKGALQGHRSILGHMPGNEMMYDFMPQAHDVMWSPADWSWLAGLMDVLMPAWFCGLPVLTYRSASFDAEEAFRLMGKHRVTVSLLTPTMLRRLGQVRDPVQRFGLQLRAVASGGEPVGRETLEWADRTLRVHVNEVYGQTECNLVLGNCWQVLTPKPGSLGRAMPGHVAAIVDDDGRELAPGEVGQIAFRRPDPVMMLEYWRNPGATTRKYAGDWLLTGDLGHRDDDGYFWYQSRADDVITSAGYRIGPGEIEDALNGHPAVAMSAVVGVPDAVTTESIKAYVVLRAGIIGDDALADAIRESVRTRLARHETPRAITFVDALPMTATGKIVRRELRERALRGD
jgi:acetyl-CoA synthetase